MKISEIEALLRRYDAGETTPEEEERLARYFTAGPTPPQWAGYAAQFGYFRAQGQETVPAEALFDRIPFEVRTESTTAPRIESTAAPRVIHLSWGMGLAASISLLLVGFLADWVLLRGGATAVPEGVVGAFQQYVQELNIRMML